MSDVRSTTPVAEQVDHDQSSDVIAGYIIKTVMVLLGVSVAVGLFVSFFTSWGWGLLAGIATGLSILLIMYYNEIRNDDSPIDWEDYRI